MPAKTGWFPWKISLWSPTRTGERCWRALKIDQFLGVVRVEN
jgi:hypothetical protein